MRIRRVGSALVIATLVLALAAGCGKSKSASSSYTGVTTTGGCPTTETASLAKTKFVLHAGLASGAFYHWIFEPFKAGSFQSGAQGRVTAIVKAGLAGLFVVHELDVAKNDAKADPTLCKVLIAPIAIVHDAISGVVGKIKGGNVSSADLAPVDQGITSLKQQATSAGSSITDQVPSASQLANPASTGS